MRLAIINSNIIFLSHLIICYWRWYFFCFIRPSASFDHTDTSNDYHEYHHNYNPCDNQRYAINIDTLFNMFFLEILQKYSYKPVQHAGQQSTTVSKGSLYPTLWCTGQGWRCICQKVWYRLEQHSLIQAFPESCSSNILLNSNTSILPYDAE